VNYVVGVDLGQTADYTAITILEERERNSYDVRYLERLRNTPYPQIVRRLEHLVRRLPERPSMAVDATGVGRPVIDMIRDANLPADLYAITLTGGDTVTQDGMERHVPKRDVASTIAVLLQTGRLRIARGLKESETLLREFLNFRVKISLSGHDTYEAWREQEHDDLVLAVGLAAWLFENGRDGFMQYLKEEAEKVRRERAG
jgi:phage FluMu gp28-like protein